MSGKSSTISTSEPRLGNLRVQTSMYGLAVPMRWGQVRASSNLIWFGNFQAIANTTTSSDSGGKGGGGVTQVNTTYSYKAAGIMSLGRGPIVGIASAWKDKRRYSGTAVPGRQEMRTATLVVPAGGVLSVDLGGGSYLTDYGVTTATVTPQYTDRGGENGSN